MLQKISYNFVLNYVQTDRPKKHNLHNGQQAPQDRLNDQNWSSETQSNVTEKQLASYQKYCANDYDDITLSTGQLSMTNKHMITSVKVHSTLGQQWCNHIASQTTLSSGVGQPCKS